MENLGLCCNVLFYYRASEQHRILDKLLGCLAPGGDLVTGETERRIAESGTPLREAMSSAPIFKFHRR